MTADLGGWDQSDYIDCSQPLLFDTQIYLLCKSGNSITKLGYYSLLSLNLNFNYYAYGQKLLQII